MNKIHKDIKVGDHVSIIRAAAQQGFHNYSSQL